MQEQRTVQDREAVERFDTVIIGGGQAGLAVGHYLAEQDRSFVILDASERVGDAWRKRWDSLLLFTPARNDGLPRMRFPGPGDAFVTKDQMADYLESYASRFRLPVRNGVTVDGLSRQGGRFVVSAGEQRFESRNVVVAMANYQRPWVPPFADEIQPGILQLHSSEYRNTSQLREGGVLVVGAGNSGADIAMEVVRSHVTWMAGEDHGHVPFRIESPLARILLIRMVRFMGHHVMTVRTPMGRKMRPVAQAGGLPLVRVKPKDLLAAGVQRTPRVVGVREGLPVVEGGQVLDVANLLWCTGFRPGFSWISLPVLGDRGEPIHDRGVVAGEPGLYFVGLNFLYAATSDIVTGVARDAAHVAKHIAASSVLAEAKASAPTS